MRASAGDLEARPNRRSGDGNEEACRGDICEPGSCLRPVGKQGGVMGRKCDVNMDLDGAMEESMADDIVRLGIGKPVWGENVKGKGDPGWRCWRRGPVMKGDI